jgi:hypothetical protein
MRWRIESFDKSGGGTVKCNRQVIERSDRRVRLNASDDPGPELSAFVEALWFPARPVAHIESKMLSSLPGPSSYFTASNKNAVSTSSRCSAMRVRTSAAMSSTLRDSSSS